VRPRTSEGVGLARDARPDTVADQDTERRFHLADRAITVVGLAVSLVGALVVPMVATTVAPQVGVVLGISVFLAGYLLTMDLSFRARTRELEERLLRRLEEIDHRRYGSLPMQRLLSVPEIEEAVRDVVEAAADARARRMPFLANRTVERILRDRDETLRIASGVFRCADRREELRLVRYALDDTARSLRAVAGLGLDHWRLPEYDEYFELYLEHADRLEQTRVFLVTREEAEDPMMLAILERHAEAGVSTYALDRDAVPDHLRQPAVLFDDGLLLLHTRRAPTGIGAEVAFTDDPTRVLEAREDVDRLLRLANRPSSPLVLWSGDGVRSSL
jgi:hypothetical protein